MLRSSATTAASSAVAVYRTTRQHRRNTNTTTAASKLRSHTNDSSPSLAVVLALHATPQSWRSHWRAAVPHADGLCGCTRAPLHASRRTASTRQPCSTPETTATSTNAGAAAEADRARDLAASEDELRHLRQDVGTIDETGSEGSGPLNPGAPSSSPVPAASAEGGDDTSKSSGADSSGSETAPLWEEPTLADLDRSIPQVDSEFIASLIRRRNLDREDFLTRKEAVKQKVDQLTKKAAPSLHDAARLPLVGGLNLGWLTNLRAGGSGVDEADNGLVATSPDAPVVVSADVLNQLTEEEKDLLHSTRPEYDDGFVLIDCRTVNEVTSWGIIEGAKVLPAHELFEAFHATPEEFLQDYGFAKPRPDDIIICYCQYGPRSLMAAQILSWMGYLKVMHYRDGYYEWGKQYNLLLRRWMEHDKESGNELRRLATFRAGLELQREIAPEFNALPMKEAQQYLRDTTRSPGTLLVGAGLRAEAYAMVAKLTENLAPPALPGVLDSEESATGNGSSDDISGVGTVSGLASKSTQVRRKGEGQLTQFLEQATGMNPQTEMQRSAASITLGEAQATVLDSLASGSELGASPGAVTSPLQSRPRRN